ncbi:hypothetical protein CPB83DRAFT_184715 [Crepidotus variabilis]|uniref:Uncharacterized protein n=1 Tax=Crepidotus variabilis TaxID=179855 RepID=A0A9P6E3B2_9AGAR|nr:hypothetical protein CPB83DRAFT_184715 [Crepidotus variabilis]
MSRTSRHTLLFFTPPALLASFNLRRKFSAPKHGDRAMRFCFRQTYLCFYSSGTLKLPTTPPMQPRVRPPNQHDCWPLGFVTVWRSILCR